MESGAFVRGLQGSAWREEQRPSVWAHVQGAGTCDGCSRKLSSDCFALVGGTGSRVTTESEEVLKIPQEGSVEFSGRL